MKIIFFGKNGKILAHCGKQSGFKDPRILYVAETSSSVLIPARMKGCNTARSLACPRRESDCDQRVCDWRLKVYTTWPPTALLLLVPKIFLILYILSCCRGNYRAELIFVFFYQIFRDIYKSALFFWKFPRLLPCVRLV